MLVRFKLLRLVSVVVRLQAVLRVLVLVRRVAFGMPVRVRVLVHVFVLVLMHVFVLMLQLAVAMRMAVAVRVRMAVSVPVLVIGVHARLPLRTTVLENHGVRSSVCHRCGRPGRRVA